MTHENVQTWKMVTSRQGRFAGKKVHNICLNQRDYGQCQKEGCNYQHEWDKNEEPAIDEEFQIIKERTKERKELEKIEASRQVKEHTDRAKAADVGEDLR